MSSEEERRSRTIAKRFLTVEIPVLGVVSAVATLLPIIPWPYWSALGLLGTVVASFWALRTPSPPQIVNPVFPEEKDVLEVPMSHDMLEAAVHEAHQVYGHDALPLGVVERWWNRNNWAFAVLRSATGKYLGYFDLLPLSEDGVKRFESGEIEEREIEPGGVLPPWNMKEAKTLYLSSIAVLDHGTDVGKERTAKIIWGLTAYMLRYYGEEPRRVIAIAATKAGEGVLGRFGAKVIQDGTARKDKHDLYEVVVTPALIASTRKVTTRRADPPRVSFNDLPAPNANRRPV